MSCKPMLMSIKVVELFNSLGLVFKLAGKEGSPARLSKSVMKNWDF